VGIGIRVRASGPEEERKRTEKGEAMRRRDGESYERR
jgi:hypothetical protein